MLIISPCLFWEGDADEVYKLSDQERGEFLVATASPKRLMDKLRERAPFFVGDKTIASRGSRAIDDVLDRETHESKLNLSDEHKSNLLKASKAFKDYASGHLDELPDQ